MESNELKYRILRLRLYGQKTSVISKLKNLWIETFGDSNAYVDLIYDTYAEQSIIGICCNEKGELVSSLLAIPYDFEIKTDGGEVSHTIGWYLCGLATKPELRGRNIMSRLMKMTEQEIRSVGDSLLFLIPADERLEKYYMRKGYHNSYRRKIDIGSVRPSIRCERYNSGSDTPDSCQKQFYEDEKITVITYDPSMEIGELCQFLVNAEQRKEAEDENGILKMLHTDKDWETIIRENVISGGTIFIMRECGKISCVAFSENSNTSEAKIEIRQVIGKMKSRIHLIKRICGLNDVVLYVEIQDKIIEEIHRTFGSHILNETIERYIMVKTLADEDTIKSDEKTPESEIAVFAPDDQSIPKYSIFTKYKKGEEIYQIDRVGNCDTARIISFSPSSVSAFLLLD